MRVSFSLNPFSSATPCRDAYFGLNLSNLCGVPRAQYVSRNVSGSFTRLSRVQDARAGVGAAVRVAFTLNRAIRVGERVSLSLPDFTGTPPRKKEITPARPPPPLYT